jgi:hypothetical protein
MNRLMGDTLGPSSVHVEVISGVLAYCASVPLQWESDIWKCQWWKIDAGYRLWKRSATSKIGDDDMSLRAYLDA